MATKTEVLLVDDLTGEAADTTVKFSLDGTDYELDLSDENAGEMRESFAKYVSAARKVPVLPAAVGVPLSLPSPRWTLLQSGRGQLGRASLCRPEGASARTWWSSSRPPATEFAASLRGPGPM